MLTGALDYLLETIFHLFVLAALLRFFMQALRAPFRNPIAQFVVAVTDFAVKPLRRAVPGLLGLDLASFLVAWIAELVLVLLLFWVAGGPAFPTGSVFSVLLFVSVIKLLRLTIYLLMGVILIQAILSWVSPYHPIMPFFDSLTRPFLRPVRRVIPLIGGVDLSPLVILIVCQLVLIVPITWLELETQHMLLQMATT
jgi:YggT family protein